MTTKPYGLREVLKTLEMIMGESEDDSCAICGCTDDHACPEGCFWVAPGLCSACVNKSLTTLRQIVAELPEESNEPQYRRGQPIMTDEGAGKIEVDFLSDGRPQYVVGVELPGGLTRNLLVSEADIRLITENLTISRPPVTMELVEES
jgi:hypothetical protein